MSPTTEARRSALAAALVLALSLLPRLPNLDAPLLEAHDFRQTQTAMTVQTWLDQGLDVLRYETPVFGPPWTVPFEFPTFQLTAYAVARLGVPLDLACRLAGLLWFYGSAVLLFLLVRSVSGGTLAVVTLGAYVLTPFSIQWSRACLIDYASVALSLGYLLATLEWGARPRVLAALTGVALGALAYVTKITTVLAFLPAVALAMALPFLGGAGKERAATPAPAGTGRRRRALAAGALLGLPLVAGLAWTRWADHLKSASPATAWLTSTALAEWNFGTLAQRGDLENWWTVAASIVGLITPGLLILTLPFAAVFAWRRGLRDRLAVGVAATGAVLAIATFFNLYVVHDYYLIATTPALALLTAAGLVEIASLRIPARVPVLAVAALVAIFSARDALTYLRRRAYSDTRTFPIVQAAEAVRAFTPPDGWAVIEGDDWSPRILYLAHRRGFMIMKGKTDVGPLASRPEFTTIACVSCPRELLALWPRRRWVAHAAGVDVFTTVRWPEDERPRGRVDRIDCDRIEGWAWEPADPRALPQLEVLDGESPVARTSAGAFRRELAQAGIYDGRHGFSVETPASLRDGRTHRVEVRIAGDQVPLGRSVEGMLKCPTRR